MKSRFHLSFGFILLACIVFTCSCTQKSETITIIAVNDIHGGINNFPSLATLVQKYRAQDSLHTLLVDAGDRWTGNPFVDLSDERGKPIVSLMNDLKFDLTIYGNHEFDFGLEVLRNRVADSQHPYICANMDSNGSILPQPEPYLCFDVDGTKICFIGLVTTARGGYPDGFVENFGSIKFSHPIASALEHRDLRKKSDVLIGLTHIGYELDSVLAIQMPELDLIIGGHTHTVVENNKKISNTVVTQTGSRLAYANIIKFTMRGHKLENISTNLVKLDTVPPDPIFTAMVDEYKNRPELKVTVGTLAENLNKSGVMNMINDLVRKSVGADFSIYNWGGIRVESLQKGNISLADIYSIDPFGNSVAIRHMTLDQIKTMILTKFNSVGKESHRDDLYPSGFSYIVLTDARGEGVDVIIETTAKPSAKGLYKVALSDYVSSTYVLKSTGEEELTGKMLVPLILDFFADNSPYKGDNTMRIQIGRR